jgi:hypothetical protein
VVVIWSTPESLSDWLAFLALLATVFFGIASLVALAWAAWRHATTEWERAKRARDERLQELAKIIFNDGLKYGLGAQLLAIYELRRYKADAGAVGRYADVLRRNYHEQNAASELFDALNDLDVALGRKKK